MQRYQAKQTPIRPSLHPKSGVLAVIQPHVIGRGTLESAAREMVAARMALAMRNDPPEALHLALMQAYQRQSRVL